MEFARSNFLEANEVILLAFPNHMSYDPLHSLLQKKKKKKNQIYNLLGHSLHRLSLVLLASCGIFFGPPCL